MNVAKPRLLIVIGFFMMVLGILFPLFMLMHILESTFFMNFLSYILSLVGMILGIIGVVYQFRGKR